MAPHRIEVESGFLTAFSVNGLRLMLLLFGQITL